MAAPPFVAVAHETQVVHTITDFATAAFRNRLCAILLTGSLARDEGTWLRDGSRVRLAGDADCFLVFNDHAALPSPARVVQLQDAVQARLASAGIDAHIGLSPVRSDYLRELRPNIFSYELTTHAKVIWGNPAILKLAPGFTTAEIPLDDGFRILMNRMIELLEAVCASDPNSATVSTLRYRAMKLWLDMATSFLLFERHYVPTYRGRNVKLRELAANSSTPAPIPLDRFASAVSLATRCKLSDDQGLEVRLSTNLTTLIGDARALWHWELERLTASEACDGYLLHRWLAAEPVAARLRGWAAAIKRYGPKRAITRMPRWLGLARRGSPRRLIYAASSELLFAVPFLLEIDSGHHINSHWDELRCRLPIIESPDNRSSACTWRRLGRAIAFNYNFLLAPTRS